MRNSSSSVTVAMSSPCHREHGTLLLAAEDERPTVRRHLEWPQSSEVEPHVHAAYSYRGGIPKWVISEP